MRLPLIVGFASLIVLVPALAEAAPRRYYRRDVDRDDYHYRDRYHTGLFVRGVLGVGGVTADDQLNESTLSGGAGMFSIDVGGAVAPSLALHGRLSINSMFEPSVSNEGDYLGDLDDTSLTFRLLGLGLTYYLPSNLYLTGVVGFSQATFDFYGEEYDTLNGVGFSGDIGYEWPIGGDWGIGVAGRLELHNVRDDAGTISTGALGVLLSLTYF